MGEGKVAAVGISGIGRTLLRHVLGLICFGLVLSEMISFRGPVQATHVPENQTSEFTLCCGGKMTSSHAFWLPKACRLHTASSFADAVEEDETAVIV